MNSKPFSGQKPAHALPEARVYFLTYIEVLRERLARTQLCLGYLVGSLSVVIHANYASGNTGGSETICFSTLIQRETPFPSWIVVAIAVAIVGFALVVYLAEIRKMRALQVRAGIA
jgi:hypothetical protein